MEFDLLNVGGLSGGVIPVQFGVLPELDVGAPGAGPGLPPTPK